MPADDRSRLCFSRTRFLVIHNPNAGSAARRLYHATLGELKGFGAHIEVVETSRHGDGVAVATDAAWTTRFDAIVAAGGDGTVHNVAEGLVGHDMPLGIIPTGTANVFARELNLSRNPTKLAQILVHGQVHDIPMGQVNGRPFLFVVGIGFDAEAVRLFETEGTRAFGQAGFIWPALRALALRQDRPLYVTTKQGASCAHWIIITRARRYAGNLFLAGAADLRRPFFHVVRFRGSGFLIRMRQLASIALGAINHDPTIEIEAATWARIEGDRTVPVQIDGEPLGVLPLELGLHPKLLRIIVEEPRTADGHSTNEPAQPKT